MSKCFMCKNEITPGNIIISRKDEKNCLNYFAPIPLSPGSFLIERIDMQVYFSVNGERITLCRHCFSSMMETMVQGEAKGGYNWLKQWEKGE